MTCEQSLQLYPGCYVLLKDPMNERFELDNENHTTSGLLIHAGEVVQLEVINETYWDHPVTGKNTRFKYSRIPGGSDYIWPNHIECIIASDDIPPDACADPSELFGQ